MNKEIKIGQLRVWHNSNLGHKPFCKLVKNIKEAKKILNLLADYDLYQGDKVVANAQGLEMYVGKEVDYETDEGWEEWNNEKGEDISEVMRGHR